MTVLVAATVASTSTTPKTMDLLLSSTPSMTSTSLTTFKALESPERTSGLWLPQWASLRLSGPQTGTGMVDSLARFSPVLGRKSYDKSF